MNENYENQNYENNVQQNPVPPVSTPSYADSSSPYSTPGFDAPPTPHSPKKKHGGKRVVALGLCCAVIGGVIGGGGAVLGNYLLNNNATETNSTTILVGQRESSVIDVAQIDTSSIMTPAEVYAANVSSTVGITTSITTNYFGFQTTAAASGSGFILTSDGYILTNYHVIEGYSSITVTLYDGTSYAADLVGYDESNDIAVLKVDAEGLTPVVLGDSDDLNVGDTVVAIGNPLGELTFSLTSGVISALNRQITLSSSVTMDLIQTDCAINSGNSGGALFNLYGEVIGITNAKYSSSSSSEASIDNIGFAIPINSVRSIVESIIENGYITSPYIGVGVEDVSSDALSYGLPQGAVIRTITEDSPAEEAGLQVNDIITKVNDTEITGYSDLSDIISASTPGDILTLTVYRQGETLELTVEVGEQITSALGEETQSSSQEEEQQAADSPWSSSGGFSYGN